MDEWESAHFGRDEQVYCAIKVLSTDPLITISSSPGAYLAIARYGELMPQLFDRDNGLHFIVLHWTVESGHSYNFPDAYWAAKEVFPNHDFIICAANEQEMNRLAGDGIPALMAQPTMFEDERIWYPRAPFLPQLPVFDAVYNARISSEKRIELASGIDDLMLIYSTPMDMADPYVQRVQPRLRHAYFANDRMRQGQFVQLSLQQVNAYLGHARVGLTLSEAEGGSRSTMQYLMAGLPVVTTNSVGGRNRYLDGQTAIWAGDDPVQVAHAVQDLISRNLDPWHIRRRVAEKLVFDRRNFTENFNKLVRHYIGSGVDELKFDAFRGSVTLTRPLPMIVEAHAEGRSPVPEHPPDTVNFVDQARDFDFPLDPDFWAT